RAASMAAFCCASAGAASFTAAASAALGAGACSLHPTTRKKKAAKHRCMAAFYPTLNSRLSTVDCRLSTSLERTAHRRVRALGGVEGLLAAGSESGLALGRRGGVLPRLLHRLHRLLHRAGGLGLHLARAVAHLLDVVIALGDADVAAAARGGLGGVGRLVGGL